MNICDVLRQGAECLFTTNFEGGRIGTKTGEVCRGLCSFFTNMTSRQSVKPSILGYKKIDNHKFTQLPSDVLHIILSYYGEIVYRHGKYMNRIAKNDPRFQLYRPMIHTVSDTSITDYLCYTSIVYFEKRIPFILDHLRNRGWTLFLAGVNKFHTNDTKSFQLKVYTSRYKNGMNAIYITTKFIVYVHTRNGYSSAIDCDTHYQ